MNVFLLLKNLVESLLVQMIEQDEEDFSLHISTKEQKQLEVLQKIYRSYSSRTQRHKQSRSKFRLEDVPRSSKKFSEIENQVLKSISGVHDWRPGITSIIKICNPVLREKFERTKIKCFGTASTRIFHGTDDAGIENIPKEGFRDPMKSSKNGMFGKGIYFSSCASKSAQDIYTKGGNKFLLCKVILGKSKQVVKADTSLTLEKINQQGFDSVFAPSNTRATGGVIHDEYVVYHPDQVLPRYIIHYTTHDELLDTWSSTRQGLFAQMSMHAGRIRQGRFVQMPMHAGRIRQDPFSQMPMHAGRIRQGLFAQMPMHAGRIRQDPCSQTLVNVGMIRQDPFSQMPYLFNNLRILDQ